MAALKDANALDFDDLLLKTVELFEKSESVRQAVQREVPLPDGGRVPGHEPAAVPADPAARRAAPQPVRRRRPGSVDLQVARRRPARTSSTSSTTFPEAKTVRLERNYRSTQVILDAASAVIAQNRNRKEKRLYTERRGGAKILSYRAGDDLDEAEFIARTAARALHEDPENTVAVLYRTNAQSRTLEDALRRAGIAYKIIGGVRFYERKEIKDALAYLQAGAEPARRCQPAARDQRAGPRHRQGRDGVARGGRTWVDDGRPAAAAGRPAAGRDQQFALGAARPRSRAAAAGAAGQRVARRRSATCSSA